LAEYTYEEHFVAFFDILGFKDIIQGAVTEAQAIEKIQLFNDALLTGREIFHKQWSWEVDEFAVKMFSDCICVSVPAKHENVDAFFKAITYVQTTFAYNRIMLRGGVTVGRHYINEELIFGEALVEAYKLEMTTKHPHIAVSEKLREFIMPETLEYGEDPETQMRLVNAAHLQHAYVFKLRHDPVLFLGYLNFQPDDDPVAHLREHRDWIIWGLEQHRGNVGVRPKFEWLRRYHNQWCSIYEKHWDNRDELLIDESYV
jgi:hypothetical protein